MGGGKGGEVYEGASKVGRGRERERERRIKCSCCEIADRIYRKLSEVRQRVHGYEAKRRDHGLCLCPPPSVPFFFLFSGSTAAPLGSKSILAIFFPYFRT